MPEPGAIALVVGNGTLVNDKLLASLLYSRPYVLAADGGANKLLERGILPDAVLGDFDSISANYPSSIVRLSAPDQNFTDLDKAIFHLQGDGYGSIWLVGVTGERLDHTYGALSMLAKYGKQLDIAIVDDTGTARLVDGSMCLETAVGTTVSLIPLGEVAGITTAGLQWNLDGETLTPGVRDGISNETICAECEITVATGSLVVYVHHDSLDS